MADKPVIFATNEILESFRKGFMADGIHTARLPWVPRFDGAKPAYRVLVRFRYSPEELAAAPAPKPVMGGM